MNAAELAHALKAKRSGRQWVCRCVAHQDAEPSMIIFDGHTDVQVRCLAGCAPADIIAVLTHMGLWPSSGGDHKRARPAFSRPHSAARLHVSHETQDDAALVAKLWAEAHYPAFTLAEQYFEGRGLELDDDLAGRVIRFHPSCTFGAGVRMPCVLVAFEPISGAHSDAHSGVGAYAPIALLRIGLDNAGTKMGRKFLGPVGGAVIKLDPDEDVSHGLGLAEGLEKGMALRSRWQWRPIWVTGSAGKIASFPVLPGVEALTIFADNDAPKQKANGAVFYPGQDAARACAERWQLDGREVTICLPDTVDQDWHDKVVNDADA